MNGSSSSSSSDVKEDATESGRVVPTSPQWIHRSSPMALYSNGSASSNNNNNSSSSRKGNQTTPASTSTSTSAELDESVEADHGTSTAEYPPSPVVVSRDQMLLLIENAEITRQLASVRGQRDTVQRELVDTQDELQTTRRSLQSQITSLQSELSALKKIRDAPSPQASTPKTMSPDTICTATQETQQLREKLASSIEKEAQLENELFEARKQADAAREQLKESQRELKETMQSSIEREAELEHELLDAREKAVTTHEKLEESQRQLDHLSMEVEVSESAQTPDSQVALLHTQRSDLYQRVKKLLDINARFRASSVNLRRKIRQRDIILDALKQAYTEVKSESKMNEVMFERQILEWRKRSMSLEQELRECKQTLAAGTNKRSVRIHHARLIEQIEELKSENEVLIVQQKRRQEDWDQQKGLLKRNISSLESKLRAIDETSRLDTGKPDQPSPASAVGKSIRSCDETVEITHTMSMLTDDSPRKEEQSISLGRRESLKTGGFTFSTLQDQIRLLETQLKEKGIREIALMEQVAELGQTAQKAQRDAKDAEERVELLQTYLDIK